jgi:hypothetical protein
MKHIILCLGIIVGFFSFGHAQSTDTAKRSEVILSKMRQIDVLTQVIPLALTKDQINQILPAVERARAKVGTVEKEEAQILAGLEGKINDAIKKSEDSLVAPPQALLDELAQTTMKMAKKRQLVVDQNTDAVLKVFNQACNAGQKKAAANSLRPELIDPSLKSDKMTDEEKIRFFIEEILLDPQGYPVLIELLKHAS